LQKDLIRGSFVPDDILQQLRQLTRQCRSYRKTGFIYQFYIGEYGAKLLWKLFREGMTNQAGAFLNMDTIKMNPVML
jgi:hypothetical protein